MDDLLVEHHAVHQLRVQEALALLLGYLNQVLVDDYVSIPFLLYLLYGVDRYFGELLPGLSLDLVSYRSEGDLQHEVVILDGDCYPVYHCFRKLSGVLETGRYERGMDVLFNQVRGLA